MLHLGAEEPSGEGVIRIAGNLYGTVVSHINKESTGVGAVIGADRAKRVIHFVTSAANKYCCCR
jgi:hypothetical protein